MENPADQAVFATTAHFLHLPDFFVVLVLAVLVAQQVESQLSDFFAVGSAAGAEAQSPSAKMERIARRKTGFLRAEPSGWSLDGKCKACDSLLRPGRRSGALHV